MALNDKGVLEALLYTAGDEGLEEKQILEILEIDQNTLHTLITEYDASGLEIQHFGNNYVLTTKKDASEYIEKLIEQKSKLKLSQAAMEALSIIAYNQTLFRSDIDKIRISKYRRKGKQNII